MFFLGARSSADETETQTLLLAPEFGDAQRREEATLSLWSRFQGDFDLGPASIIAGVEAGYGTYDTRYFEPDGLFDPVSGGEVPFVYPIGGRSLHVGLVLSS